MFYNIIIVYFSKYPSKNAGGAKGKRKLYYAVWRI